MLVATMTDDGGHDSDYDVIGGGDSDNNNDNNHVSDDDV